MKAKAAIMKGVNEPFAIEEFEITKAEPGYAGIRLIASGVCGTDIHIHRGLIPVGLPAMIGHEFIGKVEDISEEDSSKYGILKGDNVIVDIAAPCGECLLCKNGDDANCVNMVCTNEGNPYSAPYFLGGYGEYNFTPVKNLIKLPESLDPMSVSVFACPGPTAIHAFRLGHEAGLNFRKINCAVVQGCGPVGTFAAAYLSKMGVPNVIMVSSGRNTKRGKLAQKLGVTQYFDYTEQPVEEIIAEIRKFNGGLGADLVFEASGNPNAVPQGMQMLRNRGMYLIPGQYSNSGNVSIPPQMITFNALRLIGSSQYSVIDVKDYISFLEANPDVAETAKSLATCYKIADTNKAIEDAKQRKNIKTVLIP